MRVQATHRNVDRGSRGIRFSLQQQMRVQATHHNVVVHLRERHRIRSRKDEWCSFVNNELPKVLWIILQDVCCVSPKGWPSVVMALTVVRIEPLTDS